MLPAEVRPCAAQDDVSDAFLNFQILAVHRMPTTLPLQPAFMKYDVAYVRNFRANQFGFVVHNRKSYFQ